MPVGPPKGTRYGGRGKGSLNKRTVQKVIEATEQVAEIKRKGQKKATEILNDLMQAAMSFAASQQQKIMAAAANGHESKADVELFWKAMDSAGTFAKALAPYQDPQFRAIVFTASGDMPPRPGDAAKTVQGKVVKMDPNEVVRTYQQTMRRIG